MNKLFENWRKYLNEGGALGHYDTDVDGDQDTDVQDVLKVAQAAADPHAEEEIGGIEAALGLFGVDHTNPRREELAREIYEKGFRDDEMPEEGEDLEWLKNTAEAMGVKIEPAGHWGRDYPGKPPKVSREESDELARGMRAKRRSDAAAIAAGKGVMDPYSTGYDED